MTAIVIAITMIAVVTTAVATTTVATTMDAMIADAMIKTMTATSKTLKTLIRVEPKTFQSLTSQVKLLAKR